MGAPEQHSGAMLAVRSFRGCMWVTPSFAVQSDFMRHVRHSAEDSAANEHLILGTKGQGPGSGAGPFLTGLKIGAYHVSSNQNDYSRGAA